MNGLSNFYSKYGKPTQQMVDLFAEAFTRNGSDKTGYHNYQVIYSNLFDDLDKVSDVLEMGIHMGASLRAWRDLFPNASVVGLEYNPERFFTEDRITSFYVDQTKEETFDNFINFIDGRKFNFIVDDGSHYLEETKRTFRKLLPLLETGGWFVVEDIRSEFEAEWNRVAEELPNNYTWMIVNMNDLAQTNSSDNIVLAVRKLS